MIRKSLMVAAAYLAMGSNVFAATLTADYLFNDDLTSSVGSAPAMVYGGINAPTFSTDTVNSQSDRSLNFTTGAGLTVDTAGVVTPGSYSIAMLFTYTAAPNSQYMRIIDWHNPAADAGIYIHNSLVDYYNGGDQFGTANFNLGDFHTLVFTASNSSSRVYLDGVFQTSRTFVNTNDVISGVGATFPLHFFKDDSAENAPGDVARIQLFDGVLSDAEVAALNLSASVPEPAMLPLLALASVALLRRRAARQVCNPLRRAA